MKFSICAFIFVSILRSAVSLADPILDLETKDIVTYSELSQYLVTVSQGTVIENPDFSGFLDPYLIPIANLKKEDLRFKIDKKRRVAISLNSVSPHSINELFKLDVKKYIELNGGNSFLEAKKNHYSQVPFIGKAYAYQRDWIRPEDWHSLDHPPVMNLGEDLSIWDSSQVGEKKIENSPYFDPRFQDRIDLISGYPLSFGNQLELLQNGNSFKRKLELVRGANESVLMAVMSFYCDNSSKVLEDALIEKLHQGIDVKIIVEKVWTLISMKKCFFKLKSEGADFVLADDLLKPKGRGALFHNKFLVVDGKVGVIGGANLIKNDNLSTGFNRLNTDEDVQVTGPVVGDLMQGFVDLYREFRKHPTHLHGRSIDFYADQARALKEDALNAGARGAAFYESWLKNPAKRLQGACRFVIQNPRTDRYLLSRVYNEYFKVATQSIQMQSGPYEFNTDPAQKESWNDRMFQTIFDRVDHSGVQLKTVGNGVDAGCAEYTGLIEFRLKEIEEKFRPLQKFFLNLLRKKVEMCGASEHHPFLVSILKHDGAQAWEHFEYLHTKSFQVDGIVSSVASFNFENWSAERSHESGLICMDESFNRQVLKSYLRDAVNSVPVYPE